MGLWMTNNASLICCAVIAGIFQMLYQGNQQGHHPDHPHLGFTMKLSIFFVIASWSSSVISEWLEMEHHNSAAARICGHVSLLIASVTATLLLLLPFEGMLRIWLPLVVCALHLFFVFSELHNAFCSAQSPNTQSTSTNSEAISAANGMEIQQLSSSTNQSPPVGATETEVANQVELIQITVSESPNPNQPSPAGATETEAIVDSLAVI